MTEHNGAVVCQKHSFTCASILTFTVLLAATRTMAATTYYVDCSAATNGGGTYSSPWNHLAAVNRHAAFQPGDLVLFKRGSSCAGTLAPKGSGNGTATGSYISVDAYGVGPRPIINGGISRKQTLRLYNQQYWQISNLDIIGGNQYAVNIGGDDTIVPLHHIWLINNTVHDSPANSGVMVCLCQGGQFNFDVGFDDVLIDGMIAYNAVHGDAVFVSGSNVIFRNSSVHHAGGSGMWAGGARDLLIDSNVVHDIGQDPNTGGDIGLWEFLCTDCTLQYNEVYNTSSGDLQDGGTFDIDYDNINNTVQYNYAHDADGYCVSIFGATDQGITPIVTTNAVIRYNICANTGIGTAHNPNFQPEGSIYLETWAHGRLNGIQVYNNTFYANPSSAVPVFHEVQDISPNLSVSFTGGRPNFFKNNIIYSAVPQMILTTPTSKMKFDHNLYWFVSGATSETEWTYLGKNYSDFFAYQMKTGQDAHSIYGDPQLDDPTYHGSGRPTTQFTPQPSSPVINAGTNVCARVPQCSMGTHDFLGTPIPQGSNYDIGAVEFKW